jgi:hypothetical protein
MPKLGLHIGGVEIQLHSANAALVDEFAARCVGYEPRAAVPDLIFEFEAIDDFALPSPAVREYPGFDLRALGPSVIALERLDCRGRIGDGRAHFEGLPRSYVLEAGLRVAVSLAVLRHGGLMLHSSGIARADAAWIFSGPSGAGKTTISRLLGDHATHRLGDDLTIVTPDGEGFVAHATPFAGELGPVPAHRARLDGIYFLEQGTQHRVSPLTTAAAARRILKNTMTYAATAEVTHLALAAAAALAASGLCHVLEFTKDAGVAHVLPVTCTQPEGGIP